MTKPAQKSIQPKQMVRQIRHIPYRWSYSDREVEDIYTRDFFSAGSKPGDQDLSLLAGFAEFNAAGKAVARVTDASDQEPQNILLLQSLAYQIVESIANSWAEESAQILVALAERTIMFIEEHSPEMLEPIARGRLTWPSLVRLKELNNPRKDETFLNDFSLKKRLEDMHLGKDSPTKDLSNCEPNQLARNMIDTIKENQRLLASLRIASESNPTDFQKQKSTRTFPNWVKKCEKLYIRA